jgi:cellulose biosynthesis protein BcsQ
MLLLMTEMGLIASPEAIVPVEPPYLETVGLMRVIGKINDIREGWRQQNLRVSGILVNEDGHPYSGTQPSVG